MMGLQGRQGCAAIFWKVLVTGIFAVGVRMVFAEIGMGVGERWLGVQVVHVFFICRELPRGVSHIFNGRVGEEWCKIVAGLRINHGCFPSHLCGMGLTDSLLCSLYGRIADLDHMFFGCKTFVVVTCGMVL